ncbi:NUDIX domain-containing protein [Paractinoplanes lichenicola]|uniref:NUDIX hydrolase n=1 Tax=Paractinoplanes lichenicola TaxID=2802976 RepID=A0ABS1VZM5_9ACTN|nr:NUDIX hydrolase [Actinoplanes lichenicola]MBL7259942.1 NUDIX hydrolase [Actinoplanes lichenicola]
MEIAATSSTVVYRNRWMTVREDRTVRVDADPIELARGELAEETGLRAATMTPLGHLFEAYGYCDQGFHVILATGLEAGEQRLDDEEAGLITRWFAEDELWGLVEAGRFKDAPSLAALALFGRYQGRRPTASA